MDKEETISSAESEVRRKISEIVYPKVDWPALETHIPPRVLFISGFKRTGKDCFARHLVAGKFQYRWELFSPEDGHTEFPFHDFLHAPIVAFSDALRLMVYTCLGLKNDYDYETNKENHIVPGGTYTLRSAMIDVGSGGRKSDVALWAKLAFVQFFVENSATKNDAAPKYVVCSDHRFQGEYTMSRYAGIEAVSARLFRSQVQVPNKSIESERDLDRFTTGFLFLGSIDDYESACALWPQYRCFKHVGTIE